MIKKEYFCTCPICEKEIIGKNLYKKHLTEEVEKMITKINNVIPDLNEFGISITVNKSPYTTRDYLNFNKFKQEGKSNEN